MKSGIVKKSKFVVGFKEEQALTQKAVIFLVVSLPHLHVLSPSIFSSKYRHFTKILTLFSRFFWRFFLRYSLIDFISTPSMIFCENISEIAPFFNPWIYKRDEVGLEAAHLIPISNTFSYPVQFPFLN